MPMLCPLEVPEPKSGCSVTLDPIKLMIFAELGSTVAPETLVFHELLAGKGTKPFKLVSCPTVIPAHVPACAKARPENIPSAAHRIASMNETRCALMSFIFPECSGPPGSSIGSFAYHLHRFGAAKCS